jgi:1,4-dihydroxy-2-naphthoate octaprenyltransferase
VIFNRLEKNHFKTIFEEKELPRISSKRQFQLTEQSAPREEHGSLEIFFRLTRIQFIPLILLPALFGSALAYAQLGRINFLYLALVLLGVVLLHLGANAIDDVYDFQNGVDKIANSMFPKEFGGWKPLPRGLISIENARAVSMSLFALSLIIGAYFWYLVGFWAFGLALAGVLLAYFYTAPPLKLDYHGFALGEIAILLSFGPIPVLGAYYVQTGLIPWSAFIASIPIGLLTVTVLIDHDMIFYEVYSKSKKLSLGTVLGRKNALRTSLALTVSSYIITIALAVGGVLPIYAVLAPFASTLVLARKASAFSHPREPPPYYVPFTVNGLISNWIFTLVLVLTTLL